MYRKLIAILLLNGLLNFTSEAQVTFQKIFGRSGDEGANGIYQTTDGGYILVGATTAFSVGGADILIVKTDANGDTLWTRTYGGIGDDGASFVKQTSDGGYIIAASTGSFGSGLTDAVLIKIDSIGNLNWSKTYGSAGGDVGVYAEQTFDGGYILGGTYDYSAPAWNGSFYLIKTNAIGDTIWTKIYSENASDVFRSAMQTSDSGFILTGISDGSTLVIKTDQFGVALWSKVYTSTLSQTSLDGNRVVQTTDNGFALCGEIATGVPDLFVIRLNIYGDTIWVRTMNGSGADYANGIYENSNNGFLVGGFTNSFGAGAVDYYVMKMDSSGNSIWLKTYGGSGSDNERIMQPTADGGYVLTGSTNSFGAGNGDMYLVKADSNGNSSCNQFTNNILLSTTPLVLSSPLITINFPSISVSNPAWISGRGLIESNLCSTGIQSDNATDLILKVFPNPAEDKIHLMGFKRNQSLQVKIRDLTGRVLTIQKCFPNDELILDIHRLLPGIYFITLQQKDNASTIKFIKE